MAGIVRDRTPLDEEEGLTKPHDVATLAGFAYAYVVEDETGSLPPYITEAATLLTALSTIGGRLSFRSISSLVRGLSPFAFLPMLPSSYSFLLFL